MLTDRVAVITGAASGIGRAAALLFAAEGARLALADLQVDAGTEVAAEINAHGGEAVFCEVDTRDDEGVRAFVESTFDRFGRLDCAFNNAGVEGPLGRTDELTRDEWVSTIEGNVTGTFNCLHHEIAALRARDAQASIVSTASTAGLVGIAGFPAYVASKHAIVGLTRTAALENAECGIRVNAICPGATATPMVERQAARMDLSLEVALPAFAESTPANRVAEPLEIAEAALWLCSPRSSFVTGHALAVDGGWVAR